MISFAEQMVSQIEAADDKAYQSQLAFALDKGEEHWDKMASEALARLEEEYATHSGREDSEEDS